MSLRVVHPGLLTTVQDAGRWGHQRAGVPVGGAMDPFALRAANLLVGNDEAAAVLELTLAGPTLVLERDTLLALAGADLGATLGDLPLPPWQPARAPAGTTLSFAAPRGGCRACLAVAGGVDVPPTLGSRSTFVRAGLGGVEGRALRAGDVLPCGAPSELATRIAAGLRGDGRRPVVARWGLGPSLRPEYSAAPLIRLIPGTHLSLLTPAAREALLRTDFRVSPQSDRTGYRLEGPPLELAAPTELLSEAVAFGTVQLPPNGRPIVLMADRQTTGGYPRIGEVAGVDLPLLAQLRPGDQLRFRPVALAEAQALDLARDRELRQAAGAILFQHGGSTR